VLLAPCPNPVLEGYPCRLTATACSIHSQLPSTSGGRLLHPQPEDAPCRGDMDTFNMVCEIITVNNNIPLHFGFGDVNYSNVIHKVQTPIKTVVYCAYFNED
jgi:hypothetical protein